MVACKEGEGRNMRQGKDGGNRKEGEKIEVKDVSEEIEEQREVKKDGRMHVKEVK